MWLHLVQPQLSVHWSKPRTDPPGSPQLPYKPTFHHLVIFTLFYLAPSQATAKLSATPLKEFIRETQMCYTLNLQCTPASASEVHLLEFMNTAVFFILLKKALSHSPWVSAVREQETTMKSLSDTSVSRGTARQGGEEEGEKKQLTHYTDLILIWFYNITIQYYPFTVSLRVLTELSVHLGSVRLGCSPRVQQPLHSKGHESASNSHA